MFRSNASRLLINRASSVSQLPSRSVFTSARYRTTVQTGAGARGQKRFSTHKEVSNASNVGSTSSSVKKPDADSGGIPWGLFLGLGMIGGVIGFFYRGHVNTKRRQALRLEIALGDALEGDEVEELRLKNSITDEQFKALAKRTQERFSSSGLIDADEFFEYCADQLGGQFALRDGFASSHLLERQLLALSPGSSTNGKVELPLDTLLFVLSLAVSSGPKDILHAMFSHYADVQLTPEQAKKEAEHIATLKQDEEEDADSIDAVNAVDPLRMTHPTFLRILGHFNETSQLPASARIVEVKEYPYNKYEIASTDQLAEKAIKAIVEKRKKGKILKGNEPEDISNPKETLWDADDFIQLLISRGICVWGECFVRKKN